MTKQSNQQIGIIIQARLGSTRLPGKVLRSFADGQCILDILITQLQQLNLPIVLATSHHSNDDPLAEYCERAHIQYYRGSEENVLARFIQAAEAFNVKYAVRVCADNPFFLADSIPSLLKALSATPDAEYISFQNAQGTPAIKTHWGLFGELVSIAALKKATQLTNESLYQEHVTNYIYGNPTLFKVMLMDAPAPIFARVDLRFTVDDRQDFDLAEEILQNLPVNWSLTDLIRIAEQEGRYLQEMQQNIEKYTK